MQALPGESAALADVFVNGLPGGTVEFFVEAGERPLIPAATLRLILGSIVKPEILDKVAGMERSVAEEDLEPLGVHLEYEASALSLRFTVNTRAMITKDLGIPSAETQPTGGTLFAAEAFSAMLGATIRIDPSYAFGAGGGPTAQAEIGIDAAFRIFGFVAEGGFDIDYPAPPWISLRKALLSFDFPGIGARAALGTIDPHAVSFQSPVNLVGLSFSREASLPGGKRRRPSPIEEMLLDRPADISVEINGMVARRLRLAPGSYRLPELSLATGLNTVTVRIQEEGSPPRILELGLPFDGAILPPGELEYSLNLGLDRAGLERPLGFASLSVGATPYLELGIDVSAALDGFLGGTSLLWASPIGSIAASGAVSLVKPGYAARLDWRLALPGYPYIPRIGAAVEYRSQGFTPPGEAAAEAAPETLQLSAQLSQSLPGGFGSFWAFGNTGFSAGGLSSFSFSAGFFFPLSGSASLSASGGADWRIDGGLEPRASISLSVVPPDRRNLQYRQDLAGSSQFFEISIPLDGKERFSLTARGDGLFSEGEETNGAGLSGRYAGDYVDLSASASYSAALQTGVSRMALALAASSAFAYAGGHFGVSSRLGDAFLIIVPHPSLGTDTLVLQPRDGPAAVSEGGRPRLVSGLRPYQTITATIGMPGSPPDRRPQPETVRIEPAYRSGTVVEIRAASTLAFRGRLVDQEGAVRPGRSGKVYRTGIPSLPFIATFSDEAGIFECYGVEPGEYVVEWSDGGLSRFSVGEGKTMIELGDVRASAPTRKENR